MDVSQIGTCELEWRRQRSYYYNPDGGLKSYRGKSKDNLPVVELKPFTKQVWRRAQSFPDYQSLRGVGLVSEESPRDSQDNKQTYRDTLLFLAELDSQRLLENYMYDDRGKRVPRFPLVKQFPIRPFGFATTEDRVKLTSDDIRSGSNENIRFSCLKKALSEDDLARQQKIAVRGCPVPTDNANRRIQGFAYSGEWMTRSATMPLARDRTQRVNFFTHAASMFNDLNRHYSSPEIAQHDRRQQNTVPFLVRDVPLLPMQLRFGRASPKDNATRTDAENANSKYIYRDKYRGADSCSLPGDLNIHSTNQDLERQLTKIGGKRNSPSTAPHQSVHSGYMSKNLVVRTLGPPTHGEMSLKMGIVSNMHPKARILISSDAVKRKGLGCFQNEPLARFMESESNVKSAPEGILEGSQVYTESISRKSKRMQRGNASNRSRQTMLTESPLKPHTDAISEDSDSVSMDRAMAAMTPEVLNGNESKMAMCDKNEKPASSSCSRNVKTPKSIQFDRHYIEIDDVESVRHEAKSVTPWPAPPAEESEPATNVNTQSSFHGVTQEEGTCNNPPSTPNIARGPTLQESNAPTVQHTPTSGVLSSRGSSRKLHVDLKTALDEAEEFRDEEEVEIPIGETPEPPKNSRGKTFITSRTPASAVPKEEN